MTNNLPTALPIAHNINAIVSKDGRVFIDMDYLYSEWDKVITGREYASNLIGEDIEFVSGQRYVVDSIRQQKDILSLNVSMDME